MSYQRLNQLGQSLKEACRKVRTGVWELKHKLYSLAHAPVLHELHHKLMLIKSMKNLKMARYSSVSNHDLKLKSEKSISNRQTQLL